MDESFRNLAATNGGYLHRADILAWGGSDRLIREAVRAGELRRIRVGTYAFRGPYDALSPEERHVVLARSAIDKFPVGSVALTQHSAAAMHGLSVHDVDLSVVHLVRLDGGAGRIEAGVVHHAATTRTDLVTLDDRILVSPAAAAWEVACHSSSRGALVVLDSALHHDLMSAEQLEDTEGRFRHWQGSRQARLMARMADPGAETPGESLLRFVCYESHLPRPDTQVEIFDEDGLFVARTDLGWELYAHVAEFDGMRKYWRDLRPGEDASDVVVREKIREDAIRRRRRGVSRSIWAEVVPSGSVELGRRMRHELDQSHSLYAKGRRYFA